MLEKIRADEPDEPLWKGVKDMEAETHGVRVTFEPGIDPPLYDTGRLPGRLPALQARLMSTSDRRLTFCQVAQDSATAVRKASWPYRYWGGIP